MALDPRYAPLARLPGSGWRTDELVTPGRAAGYYDVGSGDSQSAQWFDETPETRASRREYDLWNVLGGRENTPFQSKYFEGVEEVDNGNLLIARGLQRPGEGKYNTFDAVWQKDPATGDYVLIDVADTKEKASWKKHGAGIAKVAAGLGMMYLGGLGLQALGVPGAGTVAGAGAGAGTGAGIGAGTSAFGGPLPTFGAGLGEGVIGGVDLLGSSLLTGSGGIGGAAVAGPGALAAEAAGHGAWLGEGAASGVPAWETAAAKAAGAAPAGGALKGGGGLIEKGLGWLAEQAGFPEVGKWLEGSGLGRDLLGLFGAGMQQWNIEKVAKDQREWIDAKEAATRRRRAPVRGTAGVLRVVGG